MIMLSSKSPAVCKIRSDVKHQDQRPTEPPVEPQQNALDPLMSTDIDLLISSRNIYTCIFVVCELQPVYSIHVYTHIQYFSQKAEWTSTFCCLSLVDSSQGSSP